MLGQTGAKISEYPTFWVKFSKKIKNTILWSPWKNKNRIRNPPTCQNHPKMMAKNVRFSNIGQKSAKGIKFKFINVNAV